MTDRQPTFDRIKQSAAYADRASRALPIPTGSYMGEGCTIGVLWVIFLVALNITIGLIGIGIQAYRSGNQAGVKRNDIDLRLFTDGELPFVLACVGVVPVLLMVGSYAILTSIKRRIARFSQAPTHAAPAIVVSKHSRGFGQGVTNYIVLEFEDGDRQEYRIGYEKVAALVGVGDAGVAFTWLDVFLAFDRVP